MHVTDWAKAQKEDPMLSAILDWLKAQKKTDLKTLLVEHTSSEEGWLILWNQQNFTIHQGALCLHSTPKGETKDLLLFMVPKAHCVTTLIGFHRDMDHQGHDCTLSLLWKHVWWYIFRAPARFLSNRSANFMSSIIDKICKLLSVRKLQTMPYHPQMNRLVERSHQTIMQMIGKLGEDKKADWPGHLAEIVHA